MFNPDKKFMRQAIRQALLARQKGDRPFGAVLVKDGVVVARGRNQVHSKCDHTYHAELCLIQKFCRSKKIPYLTDYTLYSSCEPCAMCSAAIVRTKVGRVVYSVSQQTLDHIAGARVGLSSKDIFQNSFYTPEVIPSFLTEEGLKVFEGYVWA